MWADTIPACLLYKVPETLGNLLKTDGKAFYRLDYKKDIYSMRTAPNNRKEQSAAHILTLLDNFDNNGLVSQAVIIPWPLWRSPNKQASHGIFQRYESLWWSKRLCHA